jgi:hypothetical protein
MAKHTLIGKLCQYKALHRDKVLFTFPIPENDIPRLEYSLQLWNPTDKITSNSLIPTWYYIASYKGIPFPKPSTYNTPYTCIPYKENQYIFETSEKVINFLVVDSCSFSIKIRNLIIGKRTFLKALVADQEQGMFYWLDSEWIEPYEGLETYMDVLKARMLDKLNI